MSFSQPRNFAEFVKTAMALLRDEYPRAYYLICAEIAGRTISIECDNQTVFLDGTALEVLFPDRIESPGVRAQTSRQTILDAIDARVTVEEAIRDGRLFISGPKDDVVRCHSALLMFVRGAVRSPSFPALMQEFRRFRAAG